MDFQIPTGDIEYIADRISITAVPTAPHDHGAALKRNRVIRIENLATVNRRGRTVAAIIASSTSLSDFRCLIRAHSPRAAASIGKTP